MQLSILLRAIFSARTDRMYPVLVAHFLQVADFILDGSFACHDPS